MGPTTAVRSALRQYARFRGRARRSEYWWFSLFNLAAVVVAAALDIALGTWVASLVVFLGLFVPGVAVSVRRLHDVGRSGWWYLLGATGVGVAVLLVWAVMDGEPGANGHGASPKAPAPTAPGALAPATP